MNNCEPTLTPTSVTGALTNRSHVFCCEALMLKIVSMLACAQGIVVARGMRGLGLPLASSSRLLSSLLLAQSLSGFAPAGGAPHERLPSPSDRACAPVRTFAYNFALQPALPQCSLVVDRRTCGRAMGVSEFSTDAAPASDVTPEDVLSFWFKDADLARNEIPKKFWFFGGEEVDREIKEKFGHCLELAIEGKLDHWKSTPRGRVALVLVLDQFSRNCYRDTSRAFAQDETALKISLDSLEQGLDLQLSNPLERHFLYLPLMHSEDPKVHVEAQRLYQKLADEHKDNPGQHKIFLDTFKFEKAHSAILNKFGRYPSRNAPLGRKSTPEEEEYLASGNLWPMED